MSGQVDRVDTTRGTVGFDFAGTRTGCSGAGKTVLYFNKGNTSSCSIDSDCGAGFLCGGKTGTGATGQCFKAARCLTISSPSEDLVTTVTPIGPGGTCTGACTDVAQYVWSTGTSNLDLQATEDPMAVGNYVSRTYNANGLPTAIVYGDNDSLASNGGGTGSRISYMFYDTTFPGKLAEVRRQSDLALPSLLCTTSITTGCAQSLYTYTADGKLHTVEQKGTTIAIFSPTQPYDYLTTNTYDTKGRITETDGPATGMKTVYEYWSSTDPLKDAFLQNYKRYKDATHYLIQSSFSFDFWGNVTGLTDVDSNVNCHTFDASRGYLIERRRQMNGQTDCTSNSLDIVTSWLRDSALRLTKMTRPDGSCLMYEYDTKGRLARTKRRDDCNAASAGDREEYVYDTEGLVSEIDTYNSSSTITRKRLFAYYASRRLQEIVNPVDTSKFTGIVYDNRGMLVEVDGAGSLSKTTYTINNDNRVTGETRYKTSTTSDTWTLAYDWPGDQGSVIDGDSKTTRSKRDDMGRIVELATPDTSYPTLFMYDEAGRLVTKIEAYGGTGQLTHTFTYDSLGRPLNDDYAGNCPTGTPQPEIQRSYDALPAGVTCPLVANCFITVGQLAYVKASLMCSSAYSSTDGSLDQQTFYIHDHGERLTTEYIQDDSGRSAQGNYTYTQNGALLGQSTSPQAVAFGFGFGSTANNSDTDLQTSIYIGINTPLIDTVQWNPYGPLQQYNQQNTFGGIAERTRIARNLAYRITGLYVETQTGGTTLQSVGITEDAKGRVTARDYFPNTSGVQDSFFIYDEQDRVVCETTTSVGTCPTSGTNIKNSHSLSPPFTNAGDWQTLLRPIPGSTGLTNQFNPSGYGTTHQVTVVGQKDGTPILGSTDMAYDQRGNRYVDDNKATLSHDDRNYTYDGRRNVINVRGQYHTGSAWHFYDVASAFDAFNRRVFKSFYDETTAKTAQWFFYYDPMNRLTVVKYTPDISAASTYSVVQPIWLGDRLVMYYQQDMPSGATSKRYVGTDETGRPIDMLSWPSSGDSARVWAINPSAWGMDKNAVGPTVYQPMMFAGQYQDGETAAYLDDGVTIHRPGLVLNGFRTYDPFAGGYLQVDPLADQTWSSYLYVESDPVGKADPLGLMMGGCGSHGCLVGPTVQMDSVSNVDDGGIEIGSSGGDNYDHVDCLTCYVGCELIFEIEAANCNLLLKYPGLHAIAFWCYDLAKNSYDTCLGNCVEEGPCSPWP